MWRIDDDKLPPVRRVLFAIIKTAFLAVRFFTTKRVLTQASALTYSTLLAIVPILAVVFAIARGFGYNKFIEVWFRDAFSSQPQVAEVIIGFVNSYLVHTKSGIFLGVGLIFMLYTVMMLVSNIEQTFNEIWQVKKKRSIFRTITDYLAMFFLFPILIVVSSGISLFLATVAKSLPDFLLLGPVVRWLIDATPYVLMSLLFVGLYVFMPNTHVKVKNAIVPGILAGIAMQLVQFFYIHSQLWVTGYNAIYGSFAALPLFMLWVQISWTICLFGAELTYTSQNLDYYDYDARTDNISHRYQLMLSSVLMSRVCRRFAAGRRAATADDLRQETGIPIRIVNDLLYRLIEARLLIEISPDEKGDASRYVPAESLDRLSVGVMIDRLEAQGQWQIDLPVRQLMSSQWTEAVRLRGDYLRQSRSIRLEDLARC
ncbi:MAG: YihY/virulence factor BrkB family protein [Prevotella sp.]|nr:YihY/virulence factor BrkB family protein [Prevotella sp.]MBR1449899.1 YihY/virulence factor BrkB family protein [Prevotella sp.]